MRKKIMAVLLGGVFLLPTACASAIPSTEHIPMLSISRVNATGTQIPEVPLEEDLDGSSWEEQTEAWDPNAYAYDYSYEEAIPTEPPTTEPNRKEDRDDFYAQQQAAAWQELPDADWWHRDAPGLPDGGICALEWDEAGAGWYEEPQEYYAEDYDTEDYYTEDYGEVDYYTEDNGEDYDGEEYVVDDYDDSSYNEDYVEVYTDDSGSDYWVRDKWILYYDGQIEFYQQYALSGNTRKVTWKLNYSEMQDMYALLESKFRSCEENVGSTGDSVVWEVDYYDVNGNVIHGFHGYSYGVWTIEEIMGMLRKNEPKDELKWLLS